MTISRASDRPATWWRALQREASSVKSTAASTKLVEEGGRQHEFRFWSVTAFGVSVMVGAGIYAYSVESAERYDGPSTILAFVLAGIVCLAAAQCYAELASMVPAAGSAYTYLYATLGQLVAWIAGWIVTFEYVVTSAAVARTWSSYAGYVVGHLGGSGPCGPLVIPLGPLPLDVGAFGLVVVLAVLHVISPRWVRRASVGIAIAKVSGLVVVIAIGLTAPARAIESAAPCSTTGPLRPPGPGPLTGAWSSLPGPDWVAGVLPAAAIVVFAYVGFDAVTTVTEASARPQRDLHRGLYASLGIVLVLYTLVAGVVARLVTPDRPGPAASDPPTTLAGVFDGFASPFTGHAVTMGMVVALAAVIGLPGVILVLLYAQIRVFVAVGRDGFFPRLARHVGEPTVRHGRPGRRRPLSAILTACVLTGLIALAPVPKALLAWLPSLGDMVSFGALALLLVIAISAGYVRYTHPNLARGYWAPALYPAVAVTVIACACMLSSLPWTGWLFFGGLVVLVVIGYCARFLCCEWPAWKSRVAVESDVTRRGRSPRGRHREHA